MGHATVDRGDKETEAKKKETNGKLEESWKKGDDLRNLPMGHHRKSMPPNRATFSGAARSFARYSRSRSFARILTKPAAWLKMRLAIRDILTQTAYGEVGSGVDGVVELRSSGLEVRLYVTSCPVGPHDYVPSILLQMRARLVDECNQCR